MSEPLQGGPVGTTGRETREPIAIVGIGCRFPGGVNHPHGFWRALLDELDAITEIPPDRFDAESLYHPEPATPGRIMTRWGGFLKDIDRFDAAFFDMAPREADRLDPQQRLLLEVGWEALEDAGQPADRLRGSDTGVFVGLWLSDYEARLFADPAAVDFYMTTGSGRYAASGRLSYALGLQGPSITVDTACSSSLVAVHLACRAIWNSECGVALAAAANTILQPHITIGYSQSSMMAPDGRCKFGDAKGNGYVRSEGAAALLLKPLSRALADGDPIYALVRGSAVNNDGRSGDYMATPARAGQAQMLRLAYQDAGVSPGRIAYVEAHGTGTAAGDPIELGALGDVLTEERAQDRRCVVGSVKTNFGHTEGAAGMAGMIKAALVLRHRTVPRSLHFDEPNPNIPWDTLPLYIPREVTTLEGDAPLLAGVSSFGIAGTNAHIVLEEPPPVRTAAAATNAPVLVPLSARSPEALAALAGDVADILAGEDPPALRDVAFTAGCRRTHLDHRAAVTAGDTAELHERLRAVAAGEASPGVVTGATGAERPRVVFNFPGQGSQWTGMARELFATEPVFRQAIEECAAAMRPLVDWSLTEQLSADEDSPAYAMNRIDVIQPVLVAVDVALAALWRSWGIVPDAVVGHSMGEVAAAHVAGALDLEDAMRVVCLRSKLMRRTSGQGGMAAVELSLDEAAELLKGHEDKVSVAASNSPRATILAGDPATLKQLVEELEAREIFCRMVNVDVASHSPQMEPLQPELRAGLEGLKPRPARMPIYSTVTGQEIEGESLDADYWTRNLRQPVLFAGVIDALLTTGHNAFIEASPHPVLLPAVEQTARAAGAEALMLASLRRAEPERATMLGALGALYAAGYPVDFGKRYPEGGRHIALPRYPWQREHFWCEPAAGRRARIRTGGHPLLGGAMASATGVRIWEGEIGTDLFPFLQDHRVRGRPVLPATAYLELALAAAAEAFPAQDAALMDVVFQEALFLGDDAQATVQVVIEPATAGSADARIYSRAADAGDAAPWTLNARGTLLLRDRAGDDAESVDAARRDVSGAEQAASAAEPGPGAPPGVSSSAEPLPGDAHYDAMARRGLDYGPGFQGVAEVWRNGVRAAARVRLPEPAAAGAGEYLVHPALLDACFQVLLQTVDGGDPADTYLPDALNRLEVLRRPRADEPLWGVAVRADGDVLAGDVQLVDRDGQAVVAASGLRFHRLAAGGDVADWLYRIEWMASPARDAAEPAPPDEPGAWLLLADSGGIADALAQRLEALGEQCVRIEASTAGDLRGEVDQAVAAGQPLRGAAHLWTLDEAPIGDAGGAAPPDPDRGAVAALQLVQALAAADLPDPPRLWMFTAGAQPAGGATVCRPGAAMLWGMANVLAHEHPELRCGCIDLDPLDPAAGLDAVVAELLAGDREDRIALRGGERYLARLVRHAPDEAESGSIAAGEANSTRSGDAAPDPGQAYRVVTTSPGVLDHLVPRMTPRTPPGKGQVEIAVRATGLNFMNVMSALGIYPGYPNGVGPLGIECSGEVTAVGEGAEDLKVGDEVVAFAFHSLASHAVCDARLVAPKPPALSHEEAATLPIALLTAHFGLSHLAHMEAGERVLIHSATGGVGLAAIQLARRAGAEIFATAGTEEKRAYLRELGVEHVFDSRSLAFADEILARTGGEGVDIVLNSLAGAAIERGLSILRPYGRFVEIGKRDIYDDARIGLSPFRNGLSYFAVDLERMARERPAPLGRMLRELMADVAADELAPLPAKTFPMAEVADAFRYMAQAKHTGKVVIVTQDAAAVADRLLPAASPVRADGTYLITGGLGGLGLAVARALVDEGAKHLALLGRSAPGDAAREAIDSLEAAGARVEVIQADVAGNAALAAVFDNIAESMPPLRGVVHAAGLLADGTVLQVDRARFMEVMPPKLNGGWNLFERTADLPLDFFVLFSSVAAVLGTAGQANYAAANAFLDALALARRARGRPALSVNWGPWSDVGLAAAREDRGGRLAEQGLISLTPEQGVRAFRALLGSDAAQLTVMRFDAGRWAASNPAAADAPFLGPLRDAAATESAGSPDAAGEGGIRDAVLAAAASDRHRLMEEHLRERAAQVLRLAADRIAVDRPLKSLGMDSLMTLELRNRLEADLGLTLSATVVWNYPTITLLAGHLAGELGGASRESDAAASPTRTDTGTATSEAVEDAPELSREEIEALLASELEDIDDLLNGN